MDVICILNDKNNKYIINDNELVFKTHSLDKILSCKFNKIINNNYRMLTNYNSEIIYNLKENSLKLPVIQNIETVLLIGQHNETFIELFKKTFEEFMYETLPFNFYIHEVKYNGTYDLILNKIFDITTEKSNGFNKTKIYLDCFDNDISKKKKEIIDTINFNINRKKDLSYIICTFENNYNKITVYDLSDMENIIDTEKSNIVNYANYFTIIDFNYLQSILLNIYKDKEKKKIIEDSQLMNYFYDDFNNKIKILYNLTKLSPKTWELVNLFYEYGIKNNSTALIPYNKTEIKSVNIPKNYTLTNNLISKYNKTNNIFKPKDKKEIKQYSYKVLSKPSSSELNNFSGGLVKYTNKHKYVSQINKSKPKIKYNPNENKSNENKSDDDDYPDIKQRYSEQDVNKLIFEIIKYIPKPQDPILTFDSLMIYNKFLFNHCVKNHIKLQKAYREPQKLKSTNDEVINEFKAMLTVMLDQINDL